MLIHQGLEGEEAVLLEVREPVRRFLVRVLREQSFAEDALSETMLTLIRRLRAGVKLRRPVSFALQVAWSKALEMQKRARRQRPMPIALLKPCRSMDPAKMAELKDWLNAGLDALSPADRALLHLRYEQDLSYRDIARILDEPVGTIGRRLHDARHALRASLEESSGDSVSRTMLGILLPLMRTLDEVGRTAGPDVPIAAAASRAAASGRRLALLQKPVLASVAVILVTAAVWRLSAELPAGRVASAPAAGGPPPAVAPVAELGPEPPSARDPDPGAHGRLAISGRVVDESGTAIAGAEVRAIPWRPGPGLVWSHDPALLPPGPKTASAGDGGFEIVPGPGSTLVHLVASAPERAPAVVRDVRAGSTGVTLELARGLTIQGIVSDLAGNALAGAEVTWHARLGHARVEVTTRASPAGHYRIACLPVDPGSTRPDAATLEVRAPGHAPQLKPAAMAFARPGGSDLELDVWLARGATLEGVVRDELSDAPVAGASVELWCNPALDAPGMPELAPRGPDPVTPRLLARVRTDDGGRYRIENAPVQVAGIEPGCRYAPFIRMEKPVLAGGLVVTAPGRAAASALVPLAPADGATVAVDVALRPSIELGGRVVDAGGIPVAGAHVSVAVAGAGEVCRVTSPEAFRGEASVAATTTGGDGAWSLPDLPSAAGPLSLVVTVSGGASGDAVTSLSDVGESRRVPDIVLDAAGARRLRGVVVDGRGHAVAGAAIDIPGRTSAVADAGGTFEIAAPLPAGAPLRIRALGFADLRLTAPADPAVGLRAVLEPERRVSGRVLSAEGQPVARALVTAVPRDAGDPAEALAHIRRDPDRWIATAATDSSGGFTIRGLPREAVDLWVGIPWPRNDGVLALLLGRRFDVLVPETPSGPITVTLPAYTSARGMLRVRAVDAISQAPLLRELKGALARSDGILGGHAIFTGPGLLVFHEIPAGRYRLWVQAAGYPAISLSDVVVRDAQDSPEIRVELASGTRIRGSVRVPDGGRIDGVLQVRAEPLAGGEAVSVPCGEDRTFEIAGIAAGDWRITASLLDQRKVAIFTSRPVTVSIASGGLRPPVELSLLRIETATVRLDGVFAHGEPTTSNVEAPEYGRVIRRLSDVRVRCHDEKGTLWLDAAVSVLSWKLADRDVLVNLPLPAGAYSVAVSASGLALDSRPVSSPGSVEIPIPER